MAALPICHWVDQEFLFFFFHKMLGKNQKPFWPALDFVTGFSTSGWASLSCEEPRSK